MSDEDNSRVYSKLDKIEEKFERKFDRLDKRMDDAEKQLIVYNEHLKHHIEGVKQARTENALLRQYIDLETEKIRKDLAPIINHVKKITNFIDVLKGSWGFFIKVLGFITLITGAIYGIMQVL